MTAANSIGPTFAFRNVPLRLAMAAVICLAGAGMMGYFSIKDSRDAETIRLHGRDAIATITGVHASTAKDNTISYTLDLAWRDGSGAERHYGPTHISSNFARWIAPNDVLLTRQTAIRYLEDDPSARPIIVQDASERAMQDRVGRTMIPVFTIAGLLLAALTLWKSRRT